MAPLEVVVDALGADFVVLLKVLVAPGPDFVVLLGGGYVCVAWLALLAAVAHSPVWS